VAEHRVVTSTGGDAAGPGAAGELMTTSRDDGCEHGYSGSSRLSVERIIWFERSAHMPNVEEPEKFQQVIIAIAATHSMVRRRAGPILLGWLFSLVCGALVLAYV